MTRQKTKARQMNSSHIFSRSLTLIALAIASATLIAMAVAPAASLFAG